MALAALPHDVWKHILLHVPLKERLATCSLVCKTMHQAAAAATQALALEFTEEADIHEERSAALLHWLSKHGRHVTSIELLYADVPLALPCPQLQRLRLQGCWLEWPDCTSFSLSTELTELCVMPYSWTECYITTADLAALSKLQHLELSTLATMDEDEEMTLASDVLQHLPHLTHLSLVDPDNLLYKADFLLHISALRDLQELTLVGAGRQFRLSPSYTLGISCLTTLTMLELQDGIIDLALLEGVTQLQQLSLLSVQLAAGSSMTALLAGISRLLRLRTLVISTIAVQGGAAGIQAAAEGAAYAALTASNRLRHLTVQDCHLPSGVWQHVFPEGRRLLQCTYLNLFGQANPVVQPADIHRLVSCCPALRQLCLELEPVPQQGVMVQLTALAGAVPNATDNIPIQPLASLTGLRSLQLRSRFGGVAACLPLTCLQRLTHLHTGDTSSRRGLLTLRATPGKPPVWVQLLQACAADSSCVPQIISSLVQTHQQQVAELQVQLAGEQQQRQQQEQRLLVLEGQLAEERQQRRQQEQQLALMGTQLQQLLQVLQPSSSPPPGGEGR